VKDNQNFTAGKRFKIAINNEKPLQIAGTINAYSALLAQKSGFSCIYLSGAGVANASFGIPDLGFTSLDNVAEDTRRITQVCPLPLIVDADTGWNDPKLAIETLIKAGAAGAHIEDQIDLKRCGHRDGKHLVSIEEMQSRLQASIKGKTDPDFAIIARTDAHAVEGFQAAIHRAQHYVEAGADMIFAEAFSSLEEYTIFCNEVNVPILANITEFGKTPLFTVDELRTTGIATVLYPLSAFRAMSLAALNVYETIRKTGSQQTLIDSMQTRLALYDTLDYEKYEKEIDKTIKSTRGKS